MDLAALSDFNLVATHGGFGRASRAAGRPKATLSRRVSELEESLGVRLIERGGRSLRLTDEGRALHQRTLGPLGDIAEAGVAVGSGATSPRGLLRVSAPVVLSQVALGRIAADYVRTYPEVSVELVSEDRKVDPVEDNYDLVIRVDPDPDDQLVGRRIMTDRRVLIGPPGVPPPTGGAEENVRIEAVDLVGRPSDICWRIATEAGVYSFAPVARLRCSSFFTVRDAVVAGAGFALAPQLLVAPDIVAGRVMAWGYEHGATVAIWALQNSRRLASTKIRLFLETLARGLADGDY